MRYNCILYMDPLGVCSPICLVILRRFGDKLLGLRVAASDAAEYGL